MHIQQVHYFCALSEERNFTRAARRCGVSQPSISNAIHRLEAEFGGRLFERKRGGVGLTRLGHLLRPFFEDINRSCAAAQCEAARFFASAAGASARSAPARRGWTIARRANAAY